MTVQTAVATNGVRISEGRCLTGQARKGRTFPYFSNLDLSIFGFSFDYPVVRNGEGSTEPTFIPNDLFLKNRHGGPMNDYKLEHICPYTGHLINPPEMIGPVPEGIRVNFYSAGGEFTGSKMRGTVRSVGGDWVTIREDGVAHLDVRSTLETHDGVLILMTYLGVADFGEDGHARFL